MYAVVKTGGKQYRVEKNDVVLVEKLNANDGDQVVLGDVLMLGEGKNVTVGNPLVNDAAVMAQVVRQTRGPKITMIYKRRRKNSRRKQGHKQDLTLLKIVDIAETGGLKLTPKKAVAKPTESKAKAVEAKSKTSGTKTKVEKKAESTTTKTKVETKLNQLQKLKSIQKLNQPLQRLKLKIRLRQTLNQKNQLLKISKGFIDGT
jgi:large subunit ribosomal protein L21